MTHFCIFEIFQLNLYNFLHDAKVSFIDKKSNYSYEREAIY